MLMTSFLFQKSHCIVFVFVFLVLPSASSSEVPNLGYMHPYVYNFLSEGVHLRLAVEEKDIFVYYSFPNIYI